MLHLQQKRTHVGLHCLQQQGAQAADMVGLGQHTTQVIQCYSYDYLRARSSGPALWHSCSARSDSKKSKCKVRSSHWEGNGAHSRVDSEVQDSILRSAKIEAVRGLVQLAKSGNFPYHNTAIRAAVNLFDDSHLCDMHPCCHSTFEQL
jgi:hypothetical protein